MEAARIVLKKWNLSEDLAYNKLKWRNKIHVADFDNNDDTVLAPTSQNPVDDLDDIREFTSSHQCFLKKCK